ncbi:msx2-interacting protein-like isoform X1 [Aphis craccivora]|uniref:Msx2-interacting protein-like isoform X1 n=1 Tax=Aphis craccivora TaxID=307492 RepID=A0A6G0Z5M6_APHCR|nr:msx2-interacting protein-like isoform X1 [Aphis craccivora]
MYFLSPLEELSSFERSSHFYDREREASYRGRPTAAGYHVVSPIQGSTDPLRTRPRERTVFRAYPHESVVTSSRGHHHRVGSWAFEANNPRFNHHLSSCSSPDLTYPEDRRVDTPIIIVRNKQHLKPPSESRGCSEDRSGSPSSSSSAASHSEASSSCSSSSSPSPTQQLPRSPSPGPALSDKSSSSHSLHGSSKSSTVPSHTICAQSPNLESQTSLSLEQQRHNAICIKNLPLRSSDTSLKDGLYHEYKRHGKVTCVKVVGQGCERYALVFFKKTEDVDKALQVSHDKSFFGSKIEVSSYQGHKDVDDNESRPIETDVDEFHSKATRTLFIGNLNSNTIAADLRKNFETFGEIIEIDIKKGNNINGSTTGTYAFVQYIDISSVVKAMRTMDGEFLAGSRINLGFGKSLATTCVWIDGVAEAVSEKYLASHFNQFGSVTHCVIDRTREHALVFFQQIAHAQLAVTQMRGSIMKGRRLQVDFASRECQQGFYEHLDKTSSESSPRFTTSQQHDSTAQLSPSSTNGVAIRGFETPSSSCSSAAGDKSYPRNPDEPRVSSISVPNPQVMHNLQKERDHILEQLQLEDSISSGDEILNNESSKAQQVISRSATPLCIEHPPKSTTPPTQVPRSHVPISLPLPRFAVHVSNPLLSPPLSSPRRPQSSNSDDSQASDPGAPGLEERLRSLDEKYEQWSGSRTSVLKLDTSVRLRSRYKLLDTVDKLEPSDIVKSVLAKPSVFDEDTKRLENFSDKYIPKEFVPSRTSPNLQNFRHQQLGSFSPLTPSSSGSSKSPPASSPAAVKTQYSFPSHPQPIIITQSCRTSPTDPRLPPTDPRLIDPRLSAADPRLSADSRGSFLTKQNICTINDNRYVPDILNTKDPRHPIHKDAEIKDGPEAFYRSKIRDEYTKNWLHTFDRKDNEPTYRLVDSFDRRRFSSDYRKEEEEKIKIEQINKQKLLDGFVVKRKCSNDTIVHPSPYFVSVQEKQKNIDDLKKLTEHKKVEEITKREERIEIKKVTEEIKPPEPPPTMNNIDEDKIDFITNENTIANILLSSIENLNRKTETEETRNKVERTNSNESVSKLSDTEKKKEVINESIKKKEHERKKSIDFDHTKIKEKKDHEPKKILGSKSKECESSKSKELEFNMFEINRINKKKEELLINGKTKDIEKKKDVKFDKKPETKKEDKKKDFLKETDKKDDVDKLKDKKKDKRDKEPPKHKERKKSLDENNKHKHENSSKRSKEHYNKSKEEEKSHQNVTSDFDGKFNDDKDLKKDKRVDRNSISSNSSTGRSSKRRMSDSSENLDDSKRSKIDNKNFKDKNHKKTNDKHISFISKILDGKNREQKKEHHEKKLDKKKEERKVIKTPNETESEDDDEDEEARERRKNHSIFEVVLDEPYVSMYDKVKARSTKNMQKQEEEKRQEKLKEKFSQLKQSRAKREEKKRSTSYDGDSDSDRGLRRSSKLLITSSDDDDDYFRRKNQRPVSDSSENDRPKVQRTVSDSYESNKVKTQRGSDNYDNDRLKAQRVVSDSSENEKFKQLSKFKSRIQSECSDSDDHFVRKSSFTFDRIQNDVDIQGFNGHQKKKKQKKQKSEYSRKSIDINGLDSNHRPIKEKKKKHSISHKSNINERMQDIFGSLSDEDNEKTIVNKWSVSDVFGTDSDTEHERKENKPKMEIKKFNEFGKDVLKSLSHNVDEIARKKKKRKKDKERNKEDRREDRKEERRDDRKEERRDDRRDDRRECHLDRKEERRDDRKEKEELRKDEPRREDRKDELRKEDRKDEPRKEDRKDEPKKDEPKKEEQRREDRKEERKDELRREDRKDERKEEQRREDRKDERREEQRREDRKDEKKEDRKIEIKDDRKEEIKNDKKEIKGDRVVNIIHEERNVPKEVKCEKLVNIIHEERKVPKEVKSDRLVNTPHEERKVPKEIKSDRLTNTPPEERKISRETKHYEEIKVMDNLQSIIESKKKPKEFIANNVNTITPNRDVFSSFFDFDDSKGPEDETITIFKGDDDTVKTEVMFRKVDEKKELLFRPINTFEPIKREMIGFGSHMDDETAVKSISETPEPLVEEADPVEMASSEEKSTPVISQEETEGAVAALLEATFGQDFCDSSYSDRSAKPDTPISDSELRIDTDDEDSTDSIIDECKSDVPDSSQNKTIPSKINDEIVKPNKNEIVFCTEIIEDEKLEDEPNSIEIPKVSDVQQESPITEPLDTKPQSPLSHNFRLPQMVIQQTSIRTLNINYAKPLTEVKPPTMPSPEVSEIIAESISKPEIKAEDHVSVVKFSTSQVPTVICQEQSVISCAPILLPKQEFSQTSVLQHTKDTQIVQSCIVSPTTILPEIKKPNLDSIKEEIVEQEAVIDESKLSEELPSNQAATITFAKKLIIHDETLEHLEPKENSSSVLNHEEPLHPVVAPIETDDKSMPKHPKAKGLERIVEQINEKMRAKANETALNLTKEPIMMPLKKALIAKDKDENRSDCKVDVIEVKSKIVEMESPEDLVVAPLTPKIEDKNEVFASPGESSCEPKELDTARIKKDDEFTKDISKTIDRDSSVRGRRRGGRGRGTRGAPTIVTPRRTRQNVVTPNMPPQNTLTDIYEFTDEDEKVSQKYSKSPEPPVTSIIPNISSSPPTGTLVVSTSPLTRKSRRLQEKDGSKSTLEETIDEVARGPCTRRTTRSKPQAIPLLSLETSPRKTKQINGKKLKAESPQPVSKTETTESPLSNDQDDDKNQLSTSLLSTSSSSSTTSETTTLIDPVTGLLIPMQESEEGQYVPIDDGDNNRQVSLNKRSLSNEPPEKKARLEKSPVTSVAISKNSTTIPALAVTPNNILPATTTTYAVTPGMSNVAKTPCVMTTANSAPVGLVKPNITASVIAPTNIVKSTAVMSPSPPPLKTQPNILNKASNPVISQQPTCKPSIPISTMPPPIKSHLTAISRTPPLPKLLSPKGHIVQAYTSQSMEAVNQNSILHPSPTTQSSQPLLINTPSVMSPPLRGVLNSPSRSVLSPPSRGLLSPPSRAIVPPSQPTSSVHSSSAVPDSLIIICPKGFDPSKMENSRCIVMRSPSPLVLSGQPMSFEAGIDSTPINMVPAHHFLHPQLIYPHYIRDSMGAFIPPRNIKVVPEIEENIPPLELRKRLPDECITDRLQHNIGGTQQYINVQQVAHPIGSLPYGQVVPINYGYRPINSILKNYPIYWQGTLALKNDKALVEMHYLFGNAAVAEHSLQRNIDGELKLSQRMRLEQTQLDGVSRKMQIEDECCVLIAVPIGMSEEEWNQQSCTLHNGFITYLQQKQAAGIINITAPGSTQNAYIVHMFPPCDYINSVLATVHPAMVKQIASMAHLIIVIATV